jgi:hypothetical protein
VLLEHKALSAEGFLGKVDLFSDQLLRNGIAFTGEGKLVRKATGYEQEEAEAALSHIRFASYASRASGAPLGVYR